MKTKPWQKTVARVAWFVRDEKSAKGMMGYLANLHSQIRKREKVKTPKIMRQRTKAESQGAVTPPYWRPKRNMRVPPTTVRQPIQSIARRPGRMGVRGVLMSRKKKRTKKASPSRGCMIG